MPVEDINAEKMAAEFLNTLKSSETASEFWMNNAPIVSTLLIIVIIIGILLALVYFLKKTAKKSF